MAKAKEAEVVKTLEDLKKELADKRNLLIESKRSNAAGELQNNRVIKATRKEIARLMTEIRAQELDNLDNKESE